ncbi:MAG: general secretion pathway protein GspK [Planctomycetes bacterium]|nr:general secretion pathway protein GspK [Planctomycetota bacterium]
MEFYYESRIGLHLSENIYRGAQARHCAEGGLAVALEILNQAQRLWEDEKVWALVSGAVPLKIGQGSCTLQIEQESGKININQLRTRAGQLARDRIGHLLRMIDIYNARALDSDRPIINYGLVAAIVDWVDEDDDITVLSAVSGENRGAEGGYYTQLDDPYECRNGPFEALSELLLVKGMTEEILYGAWDEETGVHLSGLASSLTVYGSNQINLNYASPLVIQSLSEYCSAVLADSIVANRPYARVEHVKKVEGMTEQVYQDLRRSVTTTSREQVFRISATGTIGAASRSVRMVVKRNRQTGYLEPIMRWEL